MSALKYQESIKQRKTLSLQLQLLRITLKLLIVINGSTNQAWVVRHGHLAILQVTVPEMGVAHIIIMWLRLDFLCTINSVQILDIVTVFL